MKLLATFGFALLLAGCGASKQDRYDSGFRDGYAVGYNTACEIRATLIKGDWSDSEYSRGYSEGTAQGVIACNRAKQAEE